MNGGGVDLSQVLAKGNQPGATTGAGFGPQPSGSDIAGSGQSVDVPSLVLEITDATFEQLMQLSQVVPIVVALGADNCAPCDELEPRLEKLIRDMEGRLLLAKVNAQQNPGLQQAFQVQQLPTVMAVIAGQAVSLFQGAQPEDQIRAVLSQLLTMASQNGVVGRVNAPDMTSDEQQPSEPQVNPEHIPALEALERGDYSAAVSAYEQVLARAPRDSEAQAALAQVKLLERLQGTDAGQVRADAAARPDDLDAQFLVADLDVSGGHVEDAFSRLLELFQRAQADERDSIRERLLELFEVVGQTDPRVNAARTQLTNLLFS